MKEVTSIGITGDTLIIISESTRNVTIVCNLLAFSQKDIMVASGY